MSNIGTRLFVGRTDELAELEEAFTRPGEVVVHAVHGLGGVGKSALAARWAARRHEKVRWWITVDDAGVDAVDAGMGSLARALQPGLAGMPAELQTERAVAWLATHDGWLLVLDNVKEPGHIHPLLDRMPVGRGRFLVTTRRATGWHDDATTIRLGVFNPADAVDLFTRILTHQGLRDADGADTLCEELGYLALAVRQAAAFCAETGINPRAYLDMLARWPATMFAAEGGGSERTIARIWRLTLGHLEGTPLAGDILRILAWYAPDNIPRDLLHGLAERPQLAAAVGRLVAYSMITDNHDGSLSVHRLVQALARTPDPHDPHRLPKAIDHARGQATACLADTFPADVDRPETWPRCRALLPHIDSLTRHHTAGHDTAHTAYALDRAATYRIGQGALAPTIPALRRALAAQERVSGVDHPDTLHSRNNLAYAYRQAGDLDRAIALHERTLAERERVLGEDHPDTLHTRNLLAGAYRMAGNLDRAIPLYKRTLAERERVLGVDHPDTLHTRNNLASAYRQAGDLDRAIALHERTLADSERVLGEDHPDTLHSRNLLAYAYREAGDLDRAIPLHERTLAERERVLGENHPDTLHTRNNLAYAYRMAGDLDRAVALHERTLAERERILGEDHPDLLHTRNNLASAYREAGDLDRAITLYERTLADSKRALSPGHPMIAKVRANLERARST
ncbi:FxSxx-COOH system tetratricopeptide repeat protein [Streptomyces sp. NPDC050535]|uniref:FxSxx-COOH system tetratricopeptide repeat protein n=1 Tax=Streptomyces sp. NPDC050535 TaxID=3365626 RepID=UPI00379FF961